MINELLELLIATASVTGHDLPEQACRLMITRLEKYPKDAVIKSLHKCADEIKGRLTLADIINRIDDGYPAPNDAWSIGVKLFNEDASFVIPKIVLECMEGAFALSDDRVAARMAFLEKYNSELPRYREENSICEFALSLGHNVAGRKDVIVKGVEEGKIPRAYIEKYMPHIELEAPKDRLRITSEYPTMNQIQNAAPPEIKEQIRKALGRIGK